LSRSRRVGYLLKLGIVRTHPDPYSVVNDPEINFNPRALSAWQAIVSLLLLLLLLAKASTLINYVFQSVLYFLSILDHFMSILVQLPSYLSIVISKTYPLPGCQPYTRKTPKPQIASLGIILPYVSYKEITCIQGGSSQGVYIIRWDFDEFLCFMFFNNKRLDGGAVGVFDSVLAELEMRNNKRIDKQLQRHLQD
jgi:hypothetical protein